MGVVHASLTWPSIVCNFPATAGRLITAKNFASCILSILLYFECLSPSASAQTSTSQCDKLGRHIVWDKDGFLTRFLYGDQKRFSLMIDKKIVATGDVREENALSPEGLSALITKLFSGGGLLETYVVKGATVDYLKIAEAQMTVTYLRVKLDQHTVGLGFFGDRTFLPAEAVTTQVVTAYFFASKQAIMELRISYVFEVSDICVMADVVGLMMDEIKGI
jgi:hypothetical protein